MKNILIIEDEPSLAELVKDYLEINEYSANIAKTGDQGLQAALSEPYDLIVLDLMLPNLDGFQVCKRIREAKNIPIIMLTAKKEDTDKIRGLGSGADDYMVKPFSPGELTARVKAHLSRYDRLVHKDDPTDTIDIRGLQINQSSRKVFVNGTEVTMTAKEFDLLCFMADHPNHVFTKDHLFDRIWGMEAVGDVATVTVHVGKIRDKIELYPANPQYIETVWGVGYRFKG
ncbi:response regulator transcription factor [Salibacterium sp. K-3]